MACNPCLVFVFGYFGGGGGRVEGRSICMMIRDMMIPSRDGM